MRLRGFKGFTYGDWLLLCFCLGLGAGMALALMFGDYGVQEGMLWAGAGGELEGKRNEGRFWNFCGSGPRDVWQAGWQDLRYAANFCSAF